MTNVSVISFFVFLFKTVCYRSNFECVMWLYVLDKYGFTMYYTIIGRRVLWIHLYNNDHSSCRQCYENGNLIG